MAGFLSNGATIIIAVLLILAIAYRYYSAFLAAKVLALDGSRVTPAHTMNDGQNYHPTNKWILFGHHFAAISGAGPLIGPVLAAQFGYLPGLLWILIGVCLAGAVQDFVILTLSIRRNGRSLAQIAFSDIGPKSGTAATIGILFVLVIAIAGLGKVVTKALGGEVVRYDAGTQFIADTRPISSQGASGSIYTYRIPPETRIVYPNGAEQLVNTTFTLRSESQTGTPVDIEETNLPPGTRLMVPSAGMVGREAPDKVTYPPGTLFFATREKPMASKGMVDNVYAYDIPAETRIITPAGVEIKVNEPFELTVRSGPIGTAANAQRTRLLIPFGVIVMRDGLDTKVYGPETEFNATAASPMLFKGVVNNLYTYTIPVGTQIVEPPLPGATTRLTISNPAAFDIVVKPKDIEVRQAPGVRLVIPAVPADLKVSQEYPGSPWGTFTIALTIPIALLIGVYLYRIRKNRVLEASIIGGILTLAAVYCGGFMNDPESFLYIYRDTFNLSEHEVGYSIAIYGFVASILPVWMLLCPRDYLSSFLKIGTVGLLIVGVIVAHPMLHAPAISGTFLNGGPVVAGAIFPFVFITIMCGAISGFHALVASGTTPKMINKETDARTIGYGAMLIEGLVGIVALIAASSLSLKDYYDINTAAKDIPMWQAKILEVRANDPASALDAPLPDVGEHLQGRTGGAVTLAMGMAKIMNMAVVNVIGHSDKPPPWLGELFKYWYHFAIMFEALFILTTIDTGTRVGRFLLQETLGKWVHPKLGQTDWWPSAILATGLISFGWWYFLSANAFNAIWAMFGIANQMLAVMALAVATAALARGGKRKYLWVTLVPMIFVAVTTTSAAVLKLNEYFGKIAHPGPKDNLLNAWISAGCVIAIVVCTAVVAIAALGKAFRPAPDGALPVS